MKQQRTWRTVLTWTAALGLAVILLAPIWVLWWGPSKWTRHVYQEMSFRLIAERVLPTSGDEAIVYSAMNYTRRHLWLIDAVQPYDGQPIDYLVEGVGWCDYHAKVFCRLLAERGLHARYVFLKDQHGQSPHTIAEVRIQGRWRAVDPFFNLIYVQSAEWQQLEQVTPDLVERLPELQLLKAESGNAKDQILHLARETFPLRLEPIRSHDFMTNRHPFDAIADAYVMVFGKPFARWYQDAYLRRVLATEQNQGKALWIRARHYHLYGRLDEAAGCYRQLLASTKSEPYHERTVLFFSRLLTQQGATAEARALLETFVRRQPQARWAQFQLALCCEALHDRPAAIVHFQRYQELHGVRLAVLVARHLASLQKSF